LRTEFSGSPYDIKIDMLSLGSHNPSTYSEATPEQRVLGDFSNFGPVANINSLQIDRQESELNERQTTYVALAVDSDALPSVRDDDASESGELKVSTAANGSFFFERDTSADKIKSDSVDNGGAASAVRQPRKIVAEDASEISGWSNAFSAAASNAPDFEPLSSEKLFQKRASIIDRVFSKLQRREKNSGGGAFFGFAIEDEHERAKNSWNVRNSGEEDTGDTLSFPVRVPTKRASLVDRLLIRRSAQEDGDLNDDNVILSSKGKNRQDIGDQAEVSETSNTNHSNDDDDALNSGTLSLKRRSIYNVIKSISASNQTDSSNNETANSSPLERLSMKNVIKSSSTNKQLETTNTDDYDQAKSESILAKRKSLYEVIKSASTVDRSETNDEDEATYGKPDFASSKRRSIYEIIKSVSAVNQTENLVQNSNASNDDNDDNDATPIEQPEIFVAKRRSIYNILRPSATKSFEITSDTEPTDAAYAKPDHVVSKRRSIYSVLKSQKTAVNQITSDTEVDPANPKSDGVIARKRSRYNVLKSPNSATSQPDVTGDFEGDTKPDRIVSKRRSIYNVLTSAANQLTATSDPEADVIYVKPDSVTPSKRQSIYAALKTAVGKLEDSGDNSSNANVNDEAEYIKPDSALAKRRSIYTVLMSPEKSQIGNETSVTAGSTPSKRLSIYKTAKSPSTSSQAEVLQQISVSDEPAVLELTTPSKRRSIYNLIKPMGTQQQSETLTQSSNTSKNDDQEKDEEYSKTPSKRLQIYNVMTSVSSAELGSRKQKPTAASTSVVTGSETLDFRAANDSPPPSFLQEQQELQQEEVMNTPSKKKSWMQMPTNKRKESTTVLPLQAVAVAGKKSIVSVISPASVVSTPSQTATTSPASVSRQKRSSFFEKFFFRGTSSSSLFPDGRSATNASTSVVEDSSVPVTSPNTTLVSKFQRKASHRNSVVFRESLNSDHSDIDAISEEYSEDEGDGGDVLENKDAVDDERDVAVHISQENVGVRENESARATQQVASNNSSSKNPIHAATVNSSENTATVAKNDTAEEAYMSVKQRYNAQQGLGKQGSLAYEMSLEWMFY
ncbi:hypothetical protein HK100_005672, partial [Physocladia obscura]